VVIRLFSNFLVWFGSRDIPGPKDDIKGINGLNIENSRN